MYTTVLRKIRNGVYQVQWKSKLEEEIEHQKREKTKQPNYSAAVHPEGLALSTGFGRGGYKGLP